MAGQNINITASVNTTQVTAATQNFQQLQGAVSNLASQIPGLGAGFSTLSSSLSSLTGSMSGAATGIAGVASAAALAVVAIGALGIAMAFKFNDIIDGFGDLAEQLGITADQAYFLSTAAKQAGGDLNSLTNMAEKLNKAMSKSGEDTKGAGEAFKRLGVESADANGKLKSSAEVAEQLIKKWETSSQTASDYADMTLLLGKGFEKQIPVLNSVIEANKTANEFYEAGIGISTKALEVTGESEKAQLKLGAVFNSMGSILVEAVIPAFTALTSWFIESYTSGGIVAKLFTGLIVITEGVVAVVKVLAGGIIGLIEGFSIGIDVIDGFGRALIKAFSGDFTGAANSILTNMDRITKRSIELGKTFKELTPSFDGSVSAKVLEGTSAINNKAGIIAPKSSGLDSIFKSSAGGSVNQGKEAKEKVSEIEKLIQSLTSQTLAQQNLNKADLIAIELKDKKYSGASNADREKAISLAHAIDTAQTAAVVEDLNTSILKQVNSQQNLNRVDEIAIELNGKKFQNITAEQRASVLLNAAKVDEARTTKLLTDAAKSAINISDSYADSLKDEVLARKLSSREMKQHIELRKIDNWLAEEQLKLQKLGNKSSQDEEKLLEMAVAARKRVTESTNEAKAADEDWINRGLDGFISKIGTVNDTMTNWVEGSLSSLSDGLTELATGGEFSFKSFAATIVKELVKMAIQFLVIIPIIQLFKSLVGGASAGSSAGFMGPIMPASARGNAFTKNFANGGISSPGPQTGFFGGGPSMYNEAGDEAIMPLRRNAAGDLGIMVNGNSGSKGSVTQVNNITVNGGSSGNTDQDKQLAKSISDLIDKKWQENNTKAFRAGGVNNRVSLAI